MAQVRISFAEKQFMTGFEEKVEWKASCPSVEELLCLQLSGYSSRQIVGMGIEGNGQLKETAAKALREMDKARRILDRQAKLGSSPSRIMQMIIPGILITCAMTPLRPEQDIALNQYCQIVNDRK